MNFKKLSVWLCSSEQKSESSEKTDGDWWSQRRQRCMETRW